MLAAIWVTVGLAAAGWFVSSLAGNYIVAAADTRLAAILDALAAAVVVDPDGRPRLARPLPDPELGRPLSGTYWQITGPGGVARSRSLWDASLPPPRHVKSARPASRGARDTVGPRGETVRLLERRIKLAGSVRPLLVQVGESRAALNDELARLRRDLTLALALLGIGLIGGVALQVTLATRPLRVTRDALAAVPAGNLGSLRVASLSDVAPIVADADALIAQNRAIGERAQSRRQSCTWDRDPHRGIVPY